MNPIIIDKELAIERFKLNSKKYDILPYLGYDAVILIEGNTIINSDLNSETVSELFFNNRRTTKQEQVS